MLIKKETEYAILGLIGIVEEKTEKFVDIKLVAQKKKLSPTLLSKIFQKLAKKEIVESKFGPSGGFRLKKEPKEINLLEIMEAVQGKTKVLNCFLGKAIYCNGENCSIKKIALEIETNIKNYLTITNLEKIIWTKIK